MRASELVGAIAIGGAIISIPNVADASSTVSTTAYLNVRSGPSTSYQVLDVLNIGQKVKVKDEVNGWYKIDTYRGEGYISAKYTTKDSSSNSSSNSSSYKGYVRTTARLNVRTGPGMENRVVTVLGYQQKVKKIGDSESGNWSKIELWGNTYYVSSKYIKPVGAEYPLTDSSQENNSHEETSSSSQKVEKIIDYGKKFYGCTYSQANRWGPTSYDCSSFVYTVFKNTVGVNTGGWSGAMYDKFAGTKADVGVGNRKRGDILWGTTGRSNHVAIYLGNNKILHCSSSWNGVRSTEMFYYSPLKWVKCFRVI